MKSEAVILDILSSGPKDSGELVMKAALIIGDELEARRALWRLTASGEAVFSNGLKTVSLK